MEDESFTHLEDLIMEKRANIQSQIHELQERMKEIDAFLQSGREEEE